MEEEEEAKRQRRNRRPLSPPEKIGRKGTHPSAVTPEEMGMINGGVCSKALLHIVSHQSLYSSSGIALTNRPLSTVLPTHGTWLRNIPRKTQEADKEGN